MNKTFHRWHVVGRYIGVLVMLFIASPVNALDMSIDEMRSRIATDKQTIVLTADDFAHINQAALPYEGAPFSIEMLQPRLLFSWMSEDGTPLAQTEKRSYDFLLAQDPTNGAALWTTEIIDNALPAGAAAYRILLTREDSFGDSIEANNSVVRPIGNVFDADNLDLILHDVDSHVTAQSQSFIIETTRPDIDLERVFQVSFVWTYNDGELASQAVLEEVEAIGAGRYLVSFTSQKPAGANSYIVIVDASNQVREVREDNNEFLRSLFDEQGDAHDFILLENDLIVTDSFQEIAFTNRGDNNRIAGDVLVAFWWKNDQGSIEGDIFGSPAVLGEDNVWRIGFHISKPDEFIPTEYVVLIDPAQHIVETNEDNNYFAFSIDPPSLWDRLVQAFSREARVAPTPREIFFRSRDRARNEQREIGTPAAIADITDAGSIDLYVTDVESTMADTVRVKVVNKERRTISDLLPQSVDIRVTAGFNRPVQLAGDTILFEGEAVLVEEEGTYFWDTGTINIQHARERIEADAGAYITGMTAFVDPENLIPETDDQINGRYSGDVLPDFTLSQFRIVGNPYNAGIDVEFYFQNRNPVSHPPVRYEIAFYDEEGALIQAGYRSVSGQIIDVDARFTRIIGVDRFRYEDRATVIESVQIPERFAAAIVTIDPEFEVRELNKNNNTMLLHFGPNALGQIQVMPAAAEETTGNMCPAGILPGDILYPLDTLGEIIRNFFTFNDAERATRLANQACERLAEISVLAAKNKPEHIGSSIKAIQLIQGKRLAIIQSQKEKNQEGWKEQEAALLSDGIIYSIFFDKLDTQLLEETKKEIDDSLQQIVEKVSPDVVARITKKEQFSTNKLQEVIGNERLQEILHEAADAADRDEKKRIDQDRQEQSERDEKAQNDAAGDDTGSDVNESNDQERFPDCEKEAYVCIDGGDVGQQTHLKESAPENGIFLYCGDCRYEEEEIVDVPALADPYPQCAENYVCVNNPGYGEQTYLKTDNIPVGTAFLYCGDCRYEQEKVVALPDPVDPYQQCVEDYVCVNNPGYGEQTYSKRDDIPAETTFLYCGDCRYEQEVPVDVGCDETLEPVCGINGKTYSNRCLADEAGITVEYVGTCKPKEPVEQKVSVDVVITESGFNKNTLTVFRGSVIRFTNNDSVSHKITGDTSTPAIEPGKAVLISAPGYAGSFTIQLDGSSSKTIQLVTF